MIREIIGSQNDIYRIGPKDNEGRNPGGYLNADSGEIPIDNGGTGIPIPNGIVVTGSGGDEPVGVVPGKEPTGVDLPHPVGPDDEPAIVVVGQGGGEPVGGVPGKEPTGVDLPHPVDPDEPIGVDLPHPVGPDEPAIVVVGQGGGEPVGGVPGKEPTGVDLPHPLDPADLIRRIDESHPLEPDETELIPPSGIIPEGYDGFI